MRSLRATIRAVSRVMQNRPIKLGEAIMIIGRSLLAGVLALLVTGLVAAAPAAAQQQQRPNILVIMGDDVGWFNIGAYHRGMMSGKTPNLDKLASEGMMFTDYYAEASCTAGRANFITGELPMG
jgi:arylsulfatase